MAAATRQKGWPYSAGEWGQNRVRAFDHGTKGCYLEYSVGSGKERKRERVALHHHDREQAKKQCDELAAKLRTLGQLTVKGPTLESCLKTYLREVTPTKSVGKQKHDERASEMFLRFYGSQFAPCDLTVRDRDRFVAERRAGRIAPATVKEVRTVRDRIIGYDWRFLQAVMRWSYLARLIPSNPLDGLSVADERNPISPALDRAQYAALVKAAPKVHPLFSLMLVLAFETGHRGKGIRLLRWSDVNLERKLVRWRAENDKIDYEHVTPLSDNAHAALLVAWRARASLEDGFVFPSDRNATKPWPREAITRCFRRAATAAKLPKGRRLGLHSFRRTFATELKNDCNLKDLAALGGWKSTTTLVVCYIKPDEDTQRAALAKRKELRGAGGSVSNPTPQFDTRRAN